LLISVAPFKKYRNSQTPKWQIVPKFLRSALLLVERKFEILPFFHAENMWQRYKNYLYMSLKNIESFLRTFDVPGGFFL
jgi:hypothetical protein